MSCKYNNCKHCGYKSECEIYKENADLELKIKKLTQHLEPQAMTALFEQVEEEVKQGQKIEELKNRNAELKEKLKHAEENCINKTCVVFKDKEDCVAQLLELEKEISVLLSCKNCSDNKGGYICQKEYEDKCLAQKIQYIKELQEENAELKEENKKWKDEWQEQVQKENDESYARTLQTIQLNKAKELLKDITSSYGSTEVSEAQLYLKIKRAEQFLKKVENN